MKKQNKAQTKQRLIIENWDKIDYTRKEQILLHLENRACIVNLEKIETKQIIKSPFDLN